MVSRVPDCPTLLFAILSARRQLSASLMAGVFPLWYAEARLSLRNMSTFELVSLRKELVEQVQARLDQAIAALQDEPLRVRSMLLMLLSIAAAAVVISITALIVALAT